MTSFLIFFVIFWGVAVGGWWLASRHVRKSDLGKVRARLLGTAPRKSAVKSQSKQVSLIHAEDVTTGKLVLHLLHRLELRDRLQRLLEQGGLKWSVARFTHSCQGCFIAAFGIAWVWLPSNQSHWALVPGAVAAGLPILYVYRKRSDRLRQFEGQFPDSLEFVSRSMRAGHAFSVSLEMIHREFAEPLGGEFRRVFEESNLGMPLEVALEKLAQRVPSLDVHFFVSAVLLQKRTGGNLAEILDKLAYIMRERFKLRGRIRAISAHGRMTGMALSSIPIGVAALLFWANPDYVRFFIDEEVGHYLMGAAILLQLAGYLIMQKIVVIEV